MNYRNKKIFYTGLLILGLLLTVGLGSAYARETLIRNASIDSLSAKNFALIDAGVKESDITYIDIDFEKEYGTYLYDIEFIANGIKYYYHINAADGKVLSKNSRNTLAALKEQAEKQTTVQASPSIKTETKDTKPAGAKKETTPSTTTAPIKNTQSTVQNTRNVVQSNSYISIDKAKSIALSHVGVAYNTAIFETTKLEEEDGNMVYEIEFFTSDKEYDYEINAYTGEILKFSSEKQDKLPAGIINQKQNQNAATNHILYEDDDFDDDFEDDFDDDYDFDDDDHDDDDHDD